MGTRPGRVVEISIMRGTSQSFISLWSPPRWNNAATSEKNWTSSYPLKMKMNLSKAPSITNPDIFETTLSFFINRCSNLTKRVNPLIDLVVNMPRFRKFTGHNYDCAIFHPWFKKYGINYKGQIFKRSLAMQCLTKPLSKSFSICQTILSKHHLLWKILWKHIETRKAFIFLNNLSKKRSGSPKIR